MILVSEKIKVFISSICGVEKYDIARAGLKTLIEATGLATVYLFEQEGASTMSAGEHYTGALENCDLCIFLIDNKDGIKSGVQVEIDCVNKHNIKALYYFCDKDSNENTPLQKSLMGYSFAKSKVIHSFEELISKGSQDLVNDLVSIYKQYCRGRLTTTTNQEDSIGSVITFSSGLDATIATQNTIASIDRCKSYFSYMVQGSNKIVENSNSLDEWCSKFLAILFENKSIQEFNAGLFLRDLATYQDQAYHDVVKKRWEAIQAYFQDDLKGCIALLEEALAMAKEQVFPDWIIKDILIDLRNQNSIYNEMQNRYVIKDKNQEEISNSEYVLYYPLIDRFDKGLTELYIEDSFKEKIKSPYTYSFGDSLTSYTDLISNIYVVSMFNGSLTHIVMIYNRIKFLAFHLCQKYSNWEMRVLLIKNVLMTSNSKEIDGIINEAEDILEKMNSKDAIDIFNFTNNQPSVYRRQIMNLEALRIVGYFLTEEDFDSLLNQVIPQIEHWLEDSEGSVYIGEHIIRSMQGIARRMDKNKLAEICYKFLEKGKCRWVDEIFSLIAQHIELTEVSGEIGKGLIQQIIKVIQDKETATYSSSLRYMLKCLGIKDKENVYKLSEVIQKEMPNFYEEEYKLEIAQDEEKPLFIKKYVDEINIRNLEQGENGVYSGYLGHPHIVIKSMLADSKIEYQEELINEIFYAASNTLLSNRQTIEEKCDAIELLILLSKRFPAAVTNNKEIVKELINSKETVEDGKAMLSNLSAIPLKFSALFLYSCFGEDIYHSIMEMIPIFMDDIRTQLQIGKVMLTFLKEEKIENIPQNIEAVILQQGLAWCNSKQINVRRNAIEILNQLLRNEKNRGIICSQFVRSMDYDNVYIKNVMLRLISKNNMIEESVVDYLLQKAKVDSHYMVRKVSEEILADNKINSLSN